MMEYLSSGAADGIEQGNEAAAIQMFAKGSFEKTTLPMLKWVCVKVGPLWMRLSCREIIDAHIDGVHTLFKLKGEMFTLNFLSSVDESRSASSEK